MVGDIVRGIGGRPQVRKAGARAWTKAARARFLDALAVTGNAAEAARRTGTNVAGARDLKRRDAAFADLWEQALADGYARLEEELLRRALGDSASDENPTHADRASIEPAASDIDTRLALQLLEAKARRERDGNARRDRTFRRATEAETDAELLRRLAAIERRLRDTGQLPVLIALPAPGVDGAA